MEPKPKSRQKLENYIFQSLLIGILMGESSHKIKFHSPKRSFRARLPRNFTEEACKMSVSCEASIIFTEKASKNDRFARGFLKISQKNFQNDRFVRRFLKISQKKLAKQAFRERLPTIFTGKASKGSFRSRLRPNSTLWLRTILSLLRMW